MNLSPSASPQLPHLRKLPANPGIYPVDPALWPCTDTGPSVFSGSAGPGLLTFGAYYGSVCRIWILEDGMNATDIIGYSADADIYCALCAVRRYVLISYSVGDSSTIPIVPVKTTGHEGNEVHPIFGDAESDYPESCSVCLDEIPMRIIEHEELIASCTCTPSHPCRPEHKPRIL